MRTFSSAHERHCSDSVTYYAKILWINLEGLYAYPLLSNITMYKSTWYERKRFRRATFLAWSSLYAATCNLSFAKIFCGLLSIVRYMFNPCPFGGSLIWWSLRFSRADDSLLASMVKFELIPGPSEHTWMVRFLLCHLSRWEFCWLYITQMTLFYWQADVCSRLWQTVTMSLHFPDSVFINNMHDHQI